MKISNLTNLLSSSNFFRTAILFCAFLITTTGTQAQSLTFTSNGPGAGIVDLSSSSGGGAMAFAPSNPNVIYLATSSGARALWRSSDGGTTWADMNTGLPLNLSNTQASIRSIAVDPTNENIAYVGITGGVNTDTLFKTTNGGANWNASRLGLPNFLSIDTLEIHPSAPNTIYAASSNGNGGFWRSTDGGATWNLRSNGLIDSNNQIAAVVHFAVAPSNPSIIYAETRSGLYKTTDGAATWTRKTTEDYQFGEMAVHPTNSDIFYMTSRHSTLLKSTTGGETALTTVNLPNAAGAVTIAIDRTNPETVYVGTRAYAPSIYLLQTGIFKTTNGGTTWTQLRTGFPNNDFIGYLVRINPNNPSIIFAGTTVGTFKTTNGGTDWQPLNGVFDAPVRAIASAPSDSNIAYAATPAGYFKTGNAGATWTRTNAPLDPNTFSISPALSLAVSPNNSNLVYAGLSLNGLFKSADGGTTWTRTGAGFPTDFNVERIYIDPFNAENLFCLVRSNGTATTTLYKSADSGGTFSQLSLPTSGGIILTFSGVANTFYAAVNDTPSQSSGTLRVYRTTNGGFNWTQIFQNTSDRGGVVLLSPTDPNLIYIKSSRTYGCDGFIAYAPLIFRSTNGGTSFTQMASTGLAQNSNGGTLGVDPINGAIYIVGTASANECSAPETRIPGLLRSTDGGASWSLYAQGGAGGIPNGTIITTALFVGTSRTFYLGTNGAGVLVGSISQVVARRAFDFDGDGKADVSVFRPSGGVWYLQQSANGFTGLAFGASTDRIVPADYDGDGKTDVAVYRGGTWYLQRSQAGFTGITFGAADDIPVPADYDADGKADVAVFRPSTGVWYLLQSTAGFTGVAFGQNGDKPVAADYDGDGKADVAVNRAGTWYLNRSQLGFTGVAFGDGADKSVPADYDGDGKADVAVFRPSNGVWYIQQSTAGFTGIAFGLGTDLPVAADYDGDGKTDVGVFRDGVWYLQRSTQGFIGTAFGAATDKPIPNAFVP